MAFNGAAYLAANPDVAADPYFAQHPEEHYQRYGINEGRSLGTASNAGQSAAYSVQPTVYNPGIDGEAGRIGDFYAPQWLANAAGGIQNVSSNQYLLGGNTGWRVGDDLYAADQWMGEPGAYGSSSTSPAYGSNFIRYRLTPEQIAQFNNGNAEAINGAAYDVLDQNGNLVRSGNWQGIRNNGSTDFWDGLVTAAVGGVFGGAATGALSSGAGAAEGVGSGAGFVGEGATSGVPAWDAAYAGSPAWTGAAGAAGATGTSGGTASTGTAAAKGGLSSTIGNTGFTYKDLVDAGTQLIGGYLNRQAAGEAADAQLQGAREAQALAEPWRVAGIGALNRMQMLLGIGGDASNPEYGSLNKPFTFTNDDPSYQFRLNEGLKGVQNSYAGKGSFLSGAALKGIDRYGQDYASTEYGKAFDRDLATKTNAFNRLASVAGTGQTASKQMGEYATQGANAKAASTVGQANATTNALTGAWNNYQQNELMNLLLTRR